MFLIMITYNAVDYFVVLIGGAILFISEIAIFDCNEDTVTFIIRNYILQAHETV